MKTLKISDFKAKCIRVLKTVSRTREPVLITHRGKPIAKVEPVQVAPLQKTLGGLKGCMVIQGDIIHSDFNDDWEIPGR